MTHRIAHAIRRQLLGFIALLLVLTGGVAYAATAPNSVTSRSIKNGQVRTVDLAKAAVKSGKIAPAAVTGGHVADNTLTGDDVADGTLTGGDIDESTLAQVPDAATLGGIAPSSLLRTRVVMRESAVAGGTALGDGTFSLAKACDPGDVLLSGGGANVNGTSTLVESFPSPGTTNSWSVRINKNGLTDNYSVVILCVDQ